MIRKTTQNWKLSEKETPPANPPHFRIVTYNIHKGRGLDRRMRVSWVAEILRDLEPDIVALQEVLSIEGQDPEEHQARYIAEALGFDYRIGETRRLRGGAYGNVTLSRFPMILERHYDLSHHAGREERGCLRTDLRLPAGQVLQVYNIHLGTAYRERRFQARRLFGAGILDKEKRSGTSIILGDFNEWLPGLASRLLKTHYFRVPVRTRLARSRTYPGMLPLLSLDHIYYDEHLELEQSAILRSRKTLLASDHLPILADFRISFTPR